MKKLLAVAVFAAIAPSVVSAVEVPLSTSSIPVISKNLKITSTGDDVVKLQKFLVDQSLLPVSPTGYFGPITEKAVKSWQASHNIPATGFVGPITRTAIVVKAIAQASPIVLIAPQAQTAAVAPEAMPASATTSTVSDVSAQPPVVSESAQSVGSSVSSSGGSGGGSGRRSGSVPRLDLKYPNVTDVWPSDQTIATDRGVHVSFSEDIDPSTLNSNSFKVTSNGSPVSGVISYHSLQRMASFYPYSPLSPQATVDVDLTPDIRSTAGGNLTRDYKRTYTASETSSSISIRSSGYGIIAQSLSNTNPTKVTGDLGAGSVSNQNPTVYGTSNVGNSAWTSAQGDADSDISDLDTYACDSVVDGATDIGGHTFQPGTYCYTGPVTITGTTTVSGPGQYLFRFQNTFNMSSSAAVAVVNGANPNSVYWTSTGTTTLSSGSSLLGSLFTTGDVVADNSTVTGRLVAPLGTVSVASSTISIPGSVYCSLAIPVHRVSMASFKTHDGSNPTAAFIATDGTTVSGEINAQSCDFGVYVPPGAAVTVANATVHDANQVGVFNDGAAVNVSTSTIYNIGDHASDGRNGGAWALGGTQTGFAIYVATSSTGLLNGNTIYNYQKAGILARTLDGVFIRNNAVTGAGTTTAIAQIGVQLGYPTQAVSSTTISNFTGNTVTANIYGPSAAAAGVFGWLVSGEDANALMAVATSTNSLYGNQQDQDVAF